MCVKKCTEKLGVRYVTPSFSVHFFLLTQVKLGIFCQFTVVHFDFCLISHIFSCGCASKTQNETYDIKFIY